MRKVKKLWLVALILMLSVSFSYVYGATWIAQTENVTSPNYPSAYPNNQDVTVTLTKAGATSVRVHFSAFNTESGYDFVKILNGSGAEIASYNGSKGAFTSVEVPGDTIKIRFTSDYSVNASGFKIDKLEYDTDGGGGGETWASQTESVTSPNYPSAYPNNQNVTSTFTKSGATKVRVHFSAFDTESGYDFVKILNGSGTEIASYNGNKGAFTSVEVAGDTIKVKFTSDGSVTRTGFKVDKLEYVGGGGGGENQEPTANFTVSPSSGNISTTYSVNASSSSDPEDGANVQVRWDWGNDGTYDTSWSSTKTASTTYSSLGTKTIKLEVKDSGGLTATKTLTVSVNNSAPTANFTCSPTSGIKDTTTFNVNASSSSDLEDAVSALQVRWDWSNDGTYDTSWSSTKTASTTYSSTGTKTIKLEVKDSAGLTATKTFNVTISDGGGGDTWVSQTESVTSPNYPSAYPNNQNVTSTFTKSGATKVRVHFSAFDTESGYDFVKILNGSGTEVASYNGNKGAFTSVEVAGDTIKVKFTSDGSVTKTGFKVDKFEYLEGGGGTPGDTVTIYGDSFDGATSSIAGWQRGSTSYVTRYTGSPKVGTASMKIVKNYDAITYIKVTPFKNINLDFKMAASSFESGESIVCQYDIGSGWVTVATLADGSDNGVFRDYSVAIPEGSILKIKFRVNASSTWDYGYIDDISLTGEWK